MDTVPTQFHDRFAALEQENAVLRSRLYACEQACAVLQAEVATYRREEQDGHSLERCLLEATATVANTLLTIKDFDTAVNTALKILGEALETDRLAVADNFASQCGSSLPNWRLLYEWDSPGTVSQIAHPDLAQGSWKGIETWYEQLRRGQSISYFIEDTPEPFRSVQAKSGAKALHSVPIFVEGKFWGQLGFDDCREAKRRSLAEFSALKIAADCIGSAIQQNRTQQALLQAEQARSTELERINTELQQTLDRLTESEYRYRTLFELSNEGIYRFELETPVSIALPVEEQARLGIAAWRLAEANSAFCSQYGGDASKLIGKSLIEFYGNISETTWQSNLALIRNNYQIQEVETEEIGVDQQPRYFLQGIIGDVRDGYVVGGWGIQSDITELRKTQQALLKAEQERAAELAQANEALRRCLDQLAGEPDLDSILHHILTEIAVQLNAKGLAVFHYDVAAHTLNLANTFNADHSPVSDFPALDIDPEELKSFTIPVTADITPYWQTLLQFRAPMILDANNPDHVHLFWPGTREWHLRWNQPISVGVPMLVGDETLGFLGLTFEGNVTLTPEQLSLAQALTHQATLAIKLMRLAEESRQAAIVREQEQAAQNRAAELERINIQLQQSKQRLQDLLNTMTNWAWEIDANSVYTFVDEKVAKILGYSPEEMLGKTPFDFMPADEATQVFAIFSGIVAERKSFSRLENRNLTKDGHQRVFETSGTPMFDPDGKFSGYRGADCDVTELRQAQDALLQAEQERAAELAKANNALKHSLDRLAQESDLDSFLGHVLTEIAHQVQAVTGHIFLLNVETNTLELCLEIHNGQLYRQAQPDEPTLFQAAVPANITPIFHYLCQKRTLGSINSGEFDNMTWTGTLEWFEREGFSEAVGLALIVGDQPVGMLGLAFRNKFALQPEEAELIHALAHQATLAIQLTRLAEEAKQVAIFEERNRMASEIHDTLAQVFTGISLQLEVAKPLVYEEPEILEHILEHISQLAGTGLNEARRSVWALYPPAAEYADLAQMLYDSVESMTRNTSIVVEVNVQGDPCSLPPFIGMNLLRIGQEALTNALRHAQAQTVLIDLTYQPNQISLMIRDDGRGFTLPTNIDSLNGGFGLVGMYERCDRIGAQLSISSQPGQGTQILIETPLN